MKCVGVLASILLVGIFGFPCSANIVDPNRFAGNQLNASSNDINALPILKDAKQTENHQSLEQFKELKCDQNASSGDDDDDDFPPFFDDDQLRHGGIVVCFLMAIYSFTLLAIVCDKYFIPSIERLCEVLNISADVGAATFMSVATSCPELFTNLIATFVTGSSLGIGTIVGSSMFNSLGVASIGSLAAIRPIKLDWYPVTRDISIYMVAISILIAIVWDDHIYWYEGLTLFICYFLYFIVMFQNPRISRFIRRTIDKYRSNNKVDIAENGKVSESKEKEYNRDSVRASVASAFGSYAENVRRSAYENPEEFRKAREAQEAEEIKSLTKSPFTIPEGGFFTKFLFFYTWLIKMALRLTIPNPKTHPAWWPVTFMLCIFWIGGNSYIVSWMVTLIGNVLGIPSTVQGMTFVAAGGSLPETLSIAIMTRRALLGIPENMDKFDNDVQMKNISALHDVANQSYNLAAPIFPQISPWNAELPYDGGGDEFPPFLPEDQLRKGGVVLCFLIAIYCFTLLAVVCDKYFIPSIERLCEVMNISADVAAATFMSVATSCPELFTNLIATFVTQSALGIGTIVGSSMFNSLGVASIGALAAARPIKLDWWPVTRDVSIYMVAISILIAIVWDGRIYWYEGLTLFISYFVYFLVMFQNPRISRFVRRTVDRYQNKKPAASTDINEEEHKQREFNRDSVRASVASAFGTYAESARKSAFEHPEQFKKVRDIQEEQEINQIKKSPFIIPQGGWFTKLSFFYTWPIKMLLRCTIPNPKLYPDLWPLCFIMCIFYIGATSYIVSWMVTIIGDLFGIPATVQGMTFVAAGGSLPESISIAIMSRRGEGKMGVSNSLGANTMNILFSLGMPWFFMTILMDLKTDFSKGSRAFKAEPETEIGLSSKAGQIDAQL
ncbi:hypothetical protein YQE_06252, partial [Dendroctonus ponderosae]